MTLCRAAFVVAALAGASLGMGMLGYHYLEGRAWLDAFDDAALILSGMGPFVPPTQTWGKAFVGFYALYSGFVLLIAAGIMLAPVVHRVLHRFHFPEED